MKICRQCRSVYDDETFFCVNDGNTLISEDSTEVETVVNESFQIPGPAVNVCRSCGIGIPAGFEICENCRIRLAAPVDTFPGFNHPLSAPTGQNSGPGTDTVAWGQPIQMPAVAAPATGRNNNALIAILATLSIILAGIILFQLTSSSSRSGDSPAAGPENPAGETMASGKSVNSATDVRSSDANAKVPANADVTTEANNGPPAPFLPYTFQRTYRGYSNRPLEISLSKNGSSLSGVAKTPGDWDDLSGTIEPDGSFSLAGNNQGLGVTGYWRGRISPNGSIRGVWTATTGRRVSYSASQVR